MNLVAMGKRVKKFGSFEREYFTDWYGIESSDRIGVLNFNFSFLEQKQKKIRRLLDIGCGLGEFLEICERNGILCYGTEVSRWAISRARKKVRAQIIKHDAETEGLPFADNTFDAVTILDVIEHLQSEKLVVKEAFRVLKKGGVLFCTTPNEQGWYGRLAQGVFPDDPTHINKKKAGEWRSVLERTGFKEVEIRGVLLHGFPPMPRIRNKLRRWGIPVWVRPIFFPIKFFCGTLYLIARKIG